MMKVPKKTLIITSIVVLIPMLIGIYFWNQLPETMATHFNADGEANGWSSKGFVVFGLPFLMLLVHMICVACTLADPKVKNTTSKMLACIMWICPLMSVFIGVTVYSGALGYEIDVMQWAMVLMAVVFLILGNYLPKCKSNYTIGIKLPWTLNDENNWDRTHHLAGYVWVIGGIALLINAFVGTVNFMLIIILVMVLIPSIYSFLYYQKHKEK